MTAGIADDGSFVLELADGSRVRSRRVLLATGMAYEAPPIAGLAELWGRSAFHCPFCHGWEVRDQPLAVLAQGERAVHMALMLRGWTDDVVVLTNGEPGLDPAHREQLNSVGVTIDEREIAEFVSESGELAAIEFTEGQSLARRGVLVAATLHQRSTLAAQLGVAAAPPGPVTVDAIEVDPFHRTSVPGVFAAGDLHAAMPQVAAAIAAGSMAADGRRAEPARRRLRTARSALANQEHDTEGGRQCTRMNQREAPRSTGRSTTASASASGAAGSTCSWLRWWPTFHPAGRSTSAAARAATPSGWPSTAGRW